MSIYDNASFILPRSPYIKASKIYALKPTDGSGDGTFARNSVKNVIDKDGVLTEIAANVPPYDYSGGSEGVLLLEPQSTNLIPYSNEFNNPAWDQSGTLITPNSTTSPDGTNNASLLTAQASQDLKDTISAVNNTVFYTFSVYVKNIDATTLRLDMSDLTTGDVYADFDFSTNTFGSVSNFGNWTDGKTNVVSLGDGWFRLSLSAIKNSGTSILARVKDISNGLSIYIFGSQLEQLDVETSYIPTNGSTVTRLQDEPSFPIPSGVTEIIETIDGVQQTPITIIPVNYEPRDINLNSTIMN